MRLLLAAGAEAEAAPDPLGTRPAAIAAGNCDGEGLAMLRLAPRPLSSPAPMLAAWCSAGSAAVCEDGGKIRSNRGPAGGWRGEASTATALAQTLPLCASVLPNASAAGTAATVATTVAEAAAAGAPLVFADAVHSDGWTAAKARLERMALAKRGETWTSRLPKSPTAASLAYIQASRA